MTRRLRKAPEYFAVPDPADAGRMTYWRSAGRGLRAWPPAARYGPRLLRREVPAGLTGKPLRAFVTAWYRQHVAPWHDAIKTAIAEDPQKCAARFAALTTRCCLCGRSLTDPASKTYGIGPDCRAGLPGILLAELTEAVGRADAERALAPASSPEMARNDTPPSPPSPPDDGAAPDVSTASGVPGGTTSANPLRATYSQDSGPPRGTDTTATAAWPGSSQGES